MSIDMTSQFNEKGVSRKDYRLIRKILKRIFMSTEKFTPPSAISDFNLDEEVPWGTLETVLLQVHEQIIPHCIPLRNPQIISHMVPPPLTVSVIADILIGALNQCAFIWEEAPLAANLETECLIWMRRQIGYNCDSSGLLTSGGTMSNCLAVYLAIAEANKKYTPNEQKKYCIIASDQAHFSIEKAALLNGLSRNAIIKIKTDSRGKIQYGQIAEVADQAHQNGLIPILFICTAGTTNSGLMESAREFCAVARLYKAWCHLDAAFGGFMSLCDKSYVLSEKWAQADSVSWDPHKTLYVSYAVGALLLKDKAAMKPLEFHSEYALKDCENEVDAGVFHLEGSRRFEALKLWMTIKYMKEEGFRKILNKTLRNTKFFASLIRSDKDFILIAEPETNIVCFRFSNSEIDEDTLDNINKSCQEHLFRAGKSLISSTKINGKIVLRAVLINPFVETSDLIKTLENIRLEAQKSLPAILNIKGENYASKTCHQSAS
jgi:L-2,4-diaminobutyrate decarboxylase